MKIAYLLPCVFAMAVLSTPAKRNCPQNRCIYARDSCGMPFSGCWDDCELTANKRPTFVARPCSASAPVLSSTNSSTTTATAPIIRPDVTSAPKPIPYKGCKSQSTICVDLIKPCDNGRYTVPYGGCYDQCTANHVFMEPKCTLRPSNTVKPTSTKTKTKDPSSTRLACNNSKPFMCAPLNWRL